MQLFEFAVFKNEKKDRDGNVIDEARVLIKPGHMLARDSSQVNLALARQLDEADIEDADRIQIMVRPF